MRKILPVVVLAAVASCHNPTSPGCGGPCVANLAILGNTSLTAAGQTTQLVANATLADGTTQDVTTSATWRGSTQGVGSVSASGLVTTVGLGDFRVDARYGLLSASTTITIIPPGTFKLFGKVEEQGQIGIAGALVEVLDGPSAGQSRMNSPDGSYAFFGLSGDLHVRASRDGYQPDTRSVSMTHTQRLDFTLTNLAPLTPPASIAGQFGLTLTASSWCTQLPPEARIRHYTATIDQADSRVRVLLSGANFVGQATEFAGQINGTAVTLTLGGSSGIYYGRSYYEPGFIELLSPSRTLTVTGTAGGVATPAGMALQFTGALTVVQNAVTTSACTATDHQLVFTPSATTARKR